MKNKNRIWNVFIAIFLIVKVVIYMKIRQKLRYKIYRFKKEKWYHLINRLQMIGLSKRQKVDIVILRQHYRHKVKAISKMLEISNTKVLAVLYYYNCWKIKPYRDLFFMNITRENYFSF